jgi:outer membrane lipoprotein LolB
VARAARLAALLLPLLLLEACSLITMRSEKSQLAWEARRARLAQIDRFTLQARVSSGGVFGVRGTLHWEQDGDRFEMRVAGPLGVGAATITGKDRTVEIRTSKKQFTTKDPEGDLKKRLGWTFPLTHLRYWVLGQPAPGASPELTFDRDGLLETLEQDGWTLEIDEYQDAGGLQLPRKFVVENDEVRIKVVIDSWSGLPAAALASRGRG